MYLFYPKMASHDSTVEHIWQEGEAAKKERKGVREQKIGCNTGSTLSEGVM